MNGEDILLNFIMANATGGEPPLIVQVTPLFILTLNLTLSNPGRPSATSLFAQHAQKLKHVQRPKVGLMSQYCLLQAHLATEGLGLG